jgi:hypothetical protein
MIEADRATAVSVIAAYRLPGWPPGQYGVRAVDKLPKDAEIAASFTSKATIAVVTAPIPRAPEQGGLF